jgi:hypothetical protein
LIKKSNLSVHILTIVHTYEENCRVLHLIAYYDKKKDGILVTIVESSLEVPYGGKHSLSMLGEARASTPVSECLPPYGTSKLDSTRAQSIQSSAHTWAPDFFQGGGNNKFVDPIFNGQFFSTKKKFKKNVFF